MTPRDIFVDYLIYLLFFLFVSQEICDDVMDECNKHGGVLHIFVDRASPQGNVYVKCPSVTVAVNAVNSLHGRWFAGRIITAAYVPLVNYHSLFPDSITATTPLRKWWRWYLVTTLVHLENLATWQRKLKETYTNLGGTRWYARVDMLIQQRTCTDLFFSSLHPPHLEIRRIRSKKLTSSSITNSLILSFSL